MNMTGEQLKEIRLQYGLSQEEFGNTIGLSKSGISNIETNKRKVSRCVENLIRHCFIGEEIKVARKQKGMTQEELGQQVGLSTMTIRRYESGERICPEIQLSKIKKALGISDPHNIDLSTVPTALLLAEIERRCG